jgi:hypothetical protein
MSHVFCRLCSSLLYAYGHCCLSIACPLHASIVNCKSTKITNTASVLEERTEGLHHK